MTKYIFIGISLFLFCSCDSPDEDRFAVPRKTDLAANPFALHQVKLLESPFRHAFEKDREWLLSLKPDRFLYRFRKFAGLQPKDSIYGGWESEGLSGQTLGHYLSALSMAYDATGDDVFKERCDYIVDELALCQEAYGNGYVGAIPEHERIFKEVRQGQIKSAGFDLNGGWVPWYNMHKTFAGLIDTYLYTGNSTARKVVLRFGDWAVNTLEGLTEDQFQKMLACEHGGMNESLTYLYAISGEQKYLDLANRFNHQAVLNPLMNEKDELAGLHANTQIPKLIGLGRQYEYEGGEKKRIGAIFFWERVVDHHSYVIGANSNYEHFGPADDLTGQLTTNSAETCNTYNMLKLTKELFTWDPQVRYADYYERALYNHILASQNPETGMITYYVNMEPGKDKKFSTPFEDFWCCVGTGLENHVKYGESIYFHHDTTLWVNLFIPSELQWKEKGVSLKQETSFPASEKTTITLAMEQSREFEIRLRWPSWAINAPMVKINGESKKVDGVPGSYITLNRKWEDGDQIAYSLPMSLHTESLPGDSSKRALLYGPLVLAANLGEKPVAPDEIPTFIESGKPLNEVIQKVPGEELQFRTVSSVKPDNVLLKPFYTIYKDNYTLYFDFLNQEGWESKLAGLRAEKAAIEALEKNTLDVVRIGEMQPERNHNFQGENTQAGGDNDKWRHATDGGWFSYDLNLNGRSSGLNLVCRYFGPDEGNRVFDILVDGEKIGTQKLTRHGDRFYYVNYPIPDQILKGKNKITVRFQAHPGATAGGVFGCRLVENYDKLKNVVM